MGNTVGHHDQFSETQVKLGQEEIKYIFLTCFDLQVDEMQYDIC